MSLKTRYYILRTIAGIRYLRYFPQMLPASVFYFMLSGKRKEQLREDIDAFYRIEYQAKRLSDFTAFYRLMVEYNAFRNVFYYRLWRFSDMISWFMPRCKTLEIRSLTVGGDLYPTWSLNPDSSDVSGQESIYKSKCDCRLERPRLSCYR